MAAYLRENGCCERALAAGIISLSEQNRLSIDNAGGLIRLTKISASPPPRAKEEVELEILLFGTSSEWFDGTLLSPLANDFRQKVDRIACPKLLSPHFKLWLAGTIVCVIAIPVLFLGERSYPRNFSIGFTLYLLLFIGWGISSLIAALRVWPATLKKLVGELPGASSYKRRLTADDLTPFFLSCSALIGFGLLAAITSLQLSVFVALVVLVSFAFRSLLETPSRKGRRILAQLDDFREFLARTDSDRLSRQEPPPSQIAEKYGAYAVALGVEKGWREQFADMLLERIEFERAYGMGRKMADLTALDHRGFIELNLRDRK